MYAKILVPLDGSERANRILPHAEELARQLGSTLLFLQVVEPVHNVVAAEGTLIEMGSEITAGLVEEARGYVRGLAGEFAARGVDAEGLVETGPVVATINQVADREDVDLVAMASHGRSGLARVFYGSVAAGVLHQVDRPLLLIRADE